MISPLGRAWLKEVNRAINSEFDSQLARWPLASEQANLAAMEATQGWMERLPVAPMELVMVTLEALRR